ncbi:single-stranded-DNA-specific exonuclease RecJ [Paenibacillus xylaniclasticus]|uniref:single-stranded-DNA-specific exonuclease RecJ n=1 Tax=Paenibacillus xylaniclasticus TaxID=588083 RepID=UPI000FD79F54|nr:MULTISPECIES: single-stranded-DNA-specific exonuclease RecJ [Paenibacillus]GFN33593.1 single-stranded-DNA-specific exonuclease RecJ [Paenibacillus curdlanolyticus]
MIESRTRWSHPEWDERREQAAAAIMQSLKLPPLVAKLLVGRGVETAEEASAFLHGGIEQLHDPYKLAGMELAVQRIRRALEKQERIRIYGDYDADGVSSTSLMIHLLKQLGADYDYYIPHRTREGYGMNRAAVELAAEAGVSLIVTVDTGISAVDEIEYASTLGIDVVVTDHHEPPEKLPDAYAIVNPKQPGCSYPYKSLAGVGVAFKLATALLGRPPVEWADIAALGTIADVMPLTGENRVLVKLGLQKMAFGARPGFVSLAEIAGVDIARITATNVAFAMAPRINASGRLDHADGAVQLLTTSDRESADRLAARLDTLNRERQLIVEQIVEEAMRQWSDKCTAAAAAGKPEPSVIVVAGEGWNAGVIGIVASKLLERHYKPTVVLGIDSETGMCKGSARSIDGFDLHAALTECEELFEHFGGHQAAAGMSLHRDRLEELEASLVRSADAWLTPDDWIPRTTIDIVCELNELTLETIDQLAMLEPFGAGNPAPRIMIATQPIVDKRTMGKDNRHLRLTVGSGRGRIEAVGFGFGELAERISHGAAVDLLGELSVNEWNGSRKPQLMLQDLRIDQLQLFDWREEREPHALLRQLLEASSRSGRPVAIVTAAESVSETAAACARIDTGSEGYTLWQYGGTPPDDCARYRELIVYGTPPSASSLLSAVKLLPEIKAIHLLYPMKPQSNRTGRNGFPDRADFGVVYQALRRMRRAPERGLPERLAELSGWPPETMTMMLSVFEELLFIRREDGIVTVVESPAKTELSASTIYRQSQQEAAMNGIIYDSIESFAQYVTKGRLM